MENQKISVELSVADWNYILGVLGTRPFSEVGNLIPFMKAQAEGSLQATTQNNNPVPATEAAE